VRKGNLFFSAVQFIFVVALFLLGGLLIGAHYAPHLKLAIAAMITDHAVNLSLLGCMMMGCAFLLCLGFYVMYRGAYLQIEMNHGEAVIEPKLIEGLVRDYWKKRFPEKKLSAEVIIRSRKRIEVIAEMPSVEWEIQEILLPEIEQELTDLLKSHLKYQQKWTMTLIQRQAYKS
jgi:hypothetical protein